MRKKREREAHLPGLTRAATRAGPVPQPAQPTSSSLVLFLLCQEDEQRRGVARVDAGHLLLRAGGLPLRVYPCVETPRSRPEPSSPPSLPLDPVPSSASLPCTPPSGALRLRRRNHGHQPSLAHPACSRAPSRHPRPPHQAMELRTRHNVAGIAVSIAGR